MKTKRMGWLGWEREEEESVGQAFRLGVGTSRRFLVVVQSGEGRPMRLVRGVRYGNAVL